MDHLYLILIQEGGLGFVLRQHDGVPVRLLGSSKSKINHLHNARHWQSKLDSRLLLLMVSQIFKVLGPVKLDRGACVGAVQLAASGGAQREGERK